MDSLLSIVQMPKGVPVATFAIGAGGRSQCSAVRRSHRGPARHEGCRSACSSSGPGRLTPCWPVRTRARRHDDRRPGRRPARTHDGACRLPARPAVPVPRSRTGHTGPPGRTLPVRRASPIRSCSMKSPRAAKWSPSTGRTCRPQRWIAWPRARASRRRALALATAQDRLLEKTLFARLAHSHQPMHGGGFARGPAARPSRDIGLPGVLKTRRLGYDGKGQQVLRKAADIEAAWQALGTQSLLYEEFVPFDYEVSAIGVRGRDGATRDVSAEPQPAQRRHPAADARALEIRGHWKRAARAAHEPRAGAFRLLRRARHRVLCAPRPAASPTRWRRGSTTPGTGPSKARSPASSRTTCGPSPACRWASTRATRPQRHDQPHRRRCPRPVHCWRKAACTCTITASRRARDASWGT